MTNTTFNNEQFTKKLNEILFEKENLAIKI